MADTARIIDHIRSRLEATRVELDPFPHLVVTNMLPDDTYDEILRNWPPQEIGKSSNWASRKEIHVAQALESFPEAIRPVWREVVEWSQVARDLVYDKFRPYLATKFVPLMGRSRAAEMKLQRHRGPAAFIATYTGALSLFAHVDHPYIAVNGFLYVSERDVDEPDLGTILYQSYGLALPSNELKLPEQILNRYLRSVKTVAYRRNVYLGYINTPSAFHGVDPVDIGDRVRRLLMFGTVVDQRTFNEDELKRFGPSRR
jgi:hypothetical protein